MRERLFRTPPNAGCDIKARLKVRDYAITAKCCQHCRRAVLAAGLTLAVVPFASTGRAQDSAQSATAKPRIEKDLLGEKEIPANAYYGVQTARALENFQLSGVSINHYPGFVEAWAIVKLAAAQANTDVGAMKPERLAAIQKACQAVLAGKYHDQFLVDWYQGGAGTSTNMNANEVLANIGLELTGHKKGEYQFLEPHDDLNMSQSTNDSYPTAIKVAILLRNDKLIEELKRLVGVVPRERRCISRDCEDGPHRDAGCGSDDSRPGVSRIRGVAGRGNSVVARGGEISCTRSTWAPQPSAPESTCRKAIRKSAPQHLAQLTGKPIVPASDMLAATWDQQGFVVYSAALKSLAIKLSKISSDLILLTSGPRAGLFEINLPALQPGSSIMPGKVNPVVPEVMNLVAFRVMGNDYVTTLAAHSGQLQLNAYEPIEGLAMIESQSLLYNTSILFRTKCIDGITVNEKVLAHYMETTVGIVTALNPVLGYEKATELAKEAYKSGKGVLEIIREKKILTEQQIQELLDPVKLTGLDKTKYTRSSS